MKPHRRTATSPGQVLRYPCPLAELEDILRSVDLSQVREHISRLQQQLALAKRVLASRAVEQKRRQEAKHQQVLAIFMAMSSADLEQYITDGGRPHRRLAKRVLNQRAEALRRQPKPVATVRDKLPLPCEPGADSDYWRIHGG